MKKNDIIEEVPIYGSLEELCEDERPCLDVMIMGYFNRKGYTTASEALKTESPIIKDLISKVMNAECSANISSLYCGSSLEQIYGTWAKIAGPTLNSMATMQANVGGKKDSVPLILPSYCRELLRHGDLFLNGIRMLFGKGLIPTEASSPSSGSQEPIEVESLQKSGDQNVESSKLTFEKVQTYSAVAEPAPSVTSSITGTNRRKTQEPKHLTSEQQAKLSSDFLCPVPEPQRDSLDDELEAHLEAIRKKDLEQIRMEMAQELASKIESSKGDLEGIVDSFLSQKNRGSLEAQLFAFMNGNTSTISNTSEVEPPTVFNVEEQVSEASGSAVEPSNNSSTVVEPEPVSVISKSDDNNRISPEKNIQECETKSLSPEPNASDLRLVESFQNENIVVMDSGLQPPRVSPNHSQITYSPHSSSNERSQQLLEDDLLLSPTPEKRVHHTVGVVDQLSHSPHPPTPSLPDSVSKQSSCYFPQITGPSRRIQFDSEDFDPPKSPGQHELELKRASGLSQETSAETLRIQNSAIEDESVFADSSSENPFKKDGVVSYSKDELLALFDRSDDPIGELIAIQKRSCLSNNVPFLKSALSFLDSMDVSRTDFYKPVTQHLQKLLRERLEKASHDENFDFKKIENILQKTIQLINSERGGHFKDIVVDCLTKLPQSSASEGSTENRKRRCETDDAASKVPPEKKAFDSKKIEAVLAKLHGKNKP